MMKMNVTVDAPSLQTSLFIVTINKFIVTFDIFIVTIYIPTDLIFSFITENLLPKYNDFWGYITTYAHHRHKLRYIIYNDFGAIPLHMPTHVGLQKLMIS